MTEANDGYVNPKAQVPMAAGYDDGGEWASEYESFMTLLSEQTGIYSTQRVALQDARSDVDTNLRGKLQTWAQLDVDYQQSTNQFEEVRRGYEAFKSSTILEETLVNTLKNPKADGTSYQLPVSTEEDESLPGKIYAGLTLDAVETRAAEFGGSIADTLTRTADEERQSLETAYQNLSTTYEREKTRIETEGSQLTIDAEAYRLLGTVIDSLLKQYGPSDDGHDDNPMALLLNPGLSASRGNPNGFITNNDANSGYMRELPRNETRNGNGAESLMKRSEEEPPKKNKLSLLDKLRKRWNGD